MADIQFDDISTLDLQRQQLARRRKIAEELMSQRMPEARMQGNYAILPGAGNTLDAGLNRIIGNWQAPKIDQEEIANNLAARDASNAMLNSIPASGPERQQAQIRAMGNPSLRAQIQAQVGMDEKTADRQAAQTLRATPVVQRFENDRGFGKAPSGYRFNDDGTLAFIPGGPADKPAKVAATARGAAASAPGAAMDGKPLSSPQEKAALALGGDYTAVKNLADSFKDDYSGDIRNSIQRQFGDVAGGLAPEATQEMSRWWSDQAFMDELPTRHALFGAALTATEQSAWRKAAIHPGLAPSVIRERFAARQKIMEDAAGRMKASAVAGGKSGAQFDAASGIKPKPQAAPAAPQQSAPARIKSDAEYDQLPSGAAFVDPEGNVRRKP